jgi:hypothetical protein
MERKMTFFGTTMNSENESATEGSLDELPD